MRQRFELRSEVAKRRRLFGDPVTPQAGRNLEYVFADFDHVVDVTLGIGSSRDRQAHEFKGTRVLATVWCASEHHGPDLTTADAAELVESDGERLTRVFEGRDLG